MTPESEIQASLGLSDLQMRHARVKIPAGWQPGAHGEIHWDDDAIARLLEFLAEKKEGGPAYLTVFRIPINRHAVLALLDGAEVLVTGVRDNRLLTPRQLISAVQHDGVWLWHGPHATRKGQVLVRPPAPNI